MYFCNALMVEDNPNAGVGVMTRFSNRVPFENLMEDSSVEGYVGLVEGKLVVGNTGVDIFKCSEDEVKKLKAGIEDTEENPMLAILCKGVHFYKGIPTYVKYVNISKDVVLVCLVYGACEIVFGDGSTVPFMRCCNRSVSEDLKKVFYSPEKLREISRPLEMETRYDMRDDVVNAVLVTIKVNDLMSYKQVGEGIRVIDKERVEAGKQAILEKIERAKEAREQRKERLEKLQKEYTESLTKKEQEAFAKVEREKAEKRVRRESMSRQRTGNEEVTVSVGAQAFMNFVNNIKR